MHSLIKLKPEVMEENEMKACQLLRKAWGGFYSFPASNSRFYQRNLGFWRIKKKISNETKSSIIVEIGVSRNESK